MTRSMLLPLVGHPIAVAYANSADDRQQLEQSRAQIDSLQIAFADDERLRFEPDDGIPDYADDYVQLVIKHGERQAMIDWLALKPEEPAQ